MSKRSTDQIAEETYKLVSSLRKLLAGDDDYIDLGDMGELRAVDLMNYIQANMVELGYTPPHVFKSGYKPDREIG